MRCPKCHKEISDGTAICPYCHKVLALECPNCHSLGNSAVCETCGYIILTKCSKCGKTVPTTAVKCKCGFPAKSSVAYLECETDEFAAVLIQFGLKNIRRQLGSQELFTKFFNKLKNLLTAQLKSLDGKVIVYNNTFVINFNKELSFPTSANKAVRFAIKLANAFCSLNQKIVEELKVPLNLTITIVKKNAEDLLANISVNNNVKLLSVKKNDKKYLKGMQIILDQFIFDCINKDFKTDSLYSAEQNGQTLMYYEIILENYVLPPSGQVDDIPVNIIPHEINKNSAVQPSDDIYSFKVFDINAKCKFIKTNAVSFFSEFKENTITSIRSEPELGVQTNELIDYFNAKNLKVIHAVCSEELTYKPWGIFTQLFKDYYNIPLHKDFIPKDFDIKFFHAIIDLINSKPRKSAAPEDARFAYMEDFISFLKSIKDCVILIENFEYIDDTTIQTLELFFDKFSNIYNKFIFTTTQDISIHSKIKGLLQTALYTEYTLQKSGIDSILSNIKEEASDFIQSFYFEKIKENFKGSLIYFNQAIKYLTEKKVLIKFEDKLLIKGNCSVLIPATLQDLIKARLKVISKNVDASLILAYSLYLGCRLDFDILSKLGIKNVAKTAAELEASGLVILGDKYLYINNFNLIKPVIENSLKKEANDFLAKNILANLGKGLDDTAKFLIMGKLALFKEEYLILWRNSQFAMNTGDYDAYLKNCLGFLSLIEHIENNIPEEEIENNKKEVYQNILISLYNYSPEKIYSIENVLLIDAMNENNDEKIVKLSNLMLQGALIASNYTDALSLLHNILTRMQNPVLIMPDGSVNTRFLLLSLVNIEILFNIGDFTQCAEVANELLGVIKPSIIEKIKPASFSTNSFVAHILDTFRLGAFAKLILCADDLDSYFDSIKTALNTELPDKESIIAVQEFLKGKSYSTSNVENAPSFSKVIFLILQEFAYHEDDYKTFAQNIYQAKLLASDIHQTQLELFCDLLIAYSYANIGIKQKAEAIYNDVLEKAESSAIFNIIALARYFFSLLRIAENQLDEALISINDMLALLQKYNNQAQIIYIIFEKLFIETAKSLELDSIDLELEAQKLSRAIENSGFTRLS